MATVPRILLADCDAMFVAVARMEDPEGAGRSPLLVVGGSATSRGVVCSASYEVRAFGVRSGMAIATAARLCPDAMFVPVPRQSCGQKGRELAETLALWAPVVEAASIDEFYLDLTGTEMVYRGESLADTSLRIRQAAHRATGLTVSIGGGTNRLVAKLAAERAKPRPGTDGTGVLVVPPGEEGEFLATHRLADIPGVGPRLQATLGRYGLEWVNDALRVEQRDFEAWLGPRTGSWLHERIRGRAGSSVEPDAEPKSMSREETFARDIPDAETIEAELLRLTTRLGAELRANRLAARCVTIKLRDFDFKTRQASRTVAEPIDTDRAIYSVGRELYRSLRSRRNVPARLIGIGLSRFEPLLSAAQLSFLADAGPAAALETPRDRAVSKAVDRINQRFGQDAVQPARVTGRPSRRQP